MYKMDISSSTSTVPKALLNFYVKHNLVFFMYHHHIDGNKTIFTELWENQSGDFQPYKNVNNLTKLLDVN